MAKGKYTGLWSIYQEGRGLLPWLTGYSRKQSYEALIEWLYGDVGWTMFGRKLSDHPKWREMKRDGYRAVKVRVEALDAE